MAEETTNKLTDAQKIEELESIIQSLQFFSDTIRFNSNLFQGFNIILQKLTSIEGRIAKIEEILVKV